MRLAALALLLLLTGCGTIRSTANQAIAADATTTVIGIASGAAVEANPLVSSWGVGAALVVARVGAVEYTNTLDEPKRTNTLSSINAVTWGVVVNNILAIAGASHPVSLAAGVLGGLIVWDATSDERQFMESCANYIRLGWTNRCEWFRPKAIIPPTGVNS